MLAFNSMDSVHYQRVPKMLGVDEESVKICIISVAAREMPSYLKICGWIVPEYRPSPRFWSNVQLLNVSHTTLAHEGVPIHPPTTGTKSEYYQTANRDGPTYLVLLR